MASSLQGFFRIKEDYRITVSKHARLVICPQDDEVIFCKNCQNRNESIRKLSSRNIGEYLLGKALAMKQFRKEGRYG